MEDTRDNRTILLIVIAALLLHCLALIFLLVWQHHTKEHEKKFQEFMQELREKQAAAAQNIENPKTEEEWAEMKARASEFGATVIFQDEPEMSVKPIAAPTAKKQGASSEKKTKEKEQSQSKEEAPSEKSNFTDATDNILAEQTAKTNNAEVQQKAHGPQYEQAALTGMMGAGQKDAAPQPPITLSTIAKGFLSTLSDGGNDSLSMRGKKGGIAGAEQLSYQRYLEKIFRCVSNSHNIHKEKLPHMAHIRVPVNVTLRILRDGTLAESYVSLSSGFKAIDEYVLFIHRDAAPGFPPAPSAIRDDLLNFVSQGVVIIGQEESPYRFSFN